MNAINIIFKDSRSDYKIASIFDLFLFVFYLNYRNRLTLSMRLKSSLKTKKKNMYLNKKNMVLDTIICLKILRLSV